MMRWIGRWTRRVLGILVIISGGVTFRVGAQQTQGAFLPHPNTPSFGSLPVQDVELSDIDGDMDRDAVLVYSSQGSFTGPLLGIWLNTGNGAFTPHSSTPTVGTGYGISLALGDIDGDGDRDILTTALTGAITATVAVWVNDGIGGVTAHPVVPTFGGGFPLDVELGDLDRDGDLDAIIAQRNNDPETVWLNDGTGVFTPHPETPAFGAGESNAILLGDLDADLDLDVVVINTAHQAETVWLNDGTASFSPHPTVPSFGNAYSADGALGDFDGDGDSDLIVVNTGVAPQETVWLNDGTGAMIPHPQTPAFGGDDSKGIVWVDLDTDADLDVVIANGPSGSSNGAETVWLNTGLGTFQPHPITPSFGGALSTDVELGDLDGDGDQDALVANMDPGGVTVWLDETESPTATTTPDGTIAPTSTPFPPTITSTPTLTLTPTDTPTVMPTITPTLTMTPTDTPVVPTVTATVMIPTATATAGPIISRRNYLPVLMKAPPPPTPTPTPIPPTATPIPPTATPLPTATPIPPTATPPLASPSCSNPGGPAVPNTPIQIIGVNKVGETVTIKNVSTQAVNLGGWWICSITGSQMHARLSGMIAPG